LTNRYFCETCPRESAEQEYTKLSLNHGGQGDIQREKSQVKGRTIAGIEDPAFDGLITQCTQLNKYL